MVNSIEQKNFVATDSDVAAITDSILSAITAQEGGRGNYLRMLVGTTQHELGVKPPARRRKEAKLDEEGIREHLKALAAVHERFYAIVTKVAGDSVPAGTKDRGREINRRTNFARTALSSVRAWVRAGGDITTMAPRTITKTMLAVKATPRPASAQALRTKAENQSKGLMATLIGLADTDKATAIEELQLLLGQVTTQLIGMGIVATRDHSQSVSEHRPLRIGKQLFIPTATQVIDTAGRVIS